jgi:bla regulator protein BlaR1
MNSLKVQLFIKRNGLYTANPLAFGESHVKARIKNVLNYKKPRFWIIAFSIVIVTAVGVGLVADPEPKGIIGGTDEPGVVFDVEGNLDIIMSSPKTSSNPQDYINTHKNEYENFFKYGGEDALQYMLTQFESGNAKGLRGQIMMILCKELLGARNNVTDELLSPQEWYNALSIR